MVGTFTFTLLIERGRPFGGGSDEEGVGAWHLSLVFWNRHEQLGGFVGVRASTDYPTEELSLFNYQHEKNHQHCLDHPLIAK